MPRVSTEFTEGLLVRHVNNSGDLSWHKSRILISEVFPVEQLDSELITPEFHRAFF